MDLNALRHMWFEQYRFQRLVLPDMDDMLDKERANTTRDFCMYIVGEMIELLREMDWKSHRNEPGREMSRSNVLEELIDMYKYLVTLFILHGFTPDDLLAEFDRKSKVVHQRWRQEHTVWEARRVVVVDVDGTIADYIGGFFRFAEQELGSKVDVQRVASMDLPAELERLGGIPLHDGVRLKRRFREEGWKKDLRVLPGARELLNAVRYHGGQIVLLSARPYQLYRRMFADTIAWMDNNELPYDALWMQEDKRDFLLRVFPKVSMVIDDSPTEASRLGLAGYKVKVPPAAYNVGVDNLPNVERISVADLAVVIGREGLL